MRAGEGQLHRQRGLQGTLVAIAALALVTVAGSHPVSPSSSDGELMVDAAPAVTTTTEPPPAIERTTTSPPATAATTLPPPTTTAPPVAEPPPTAPAPTQSLPEPPPVPVDQPADDGGYVPGQNADEPAPPPPPIDYDPYENCPNRWQTDQDGNLVDTGCASEVFDDPVAHIENAPVPTPEDPGPPTITP